VSLIKIYFKPGTDPNAALSNIANLAMADLRRLPPGRCLRWCWEWMPRRSLYAWSR
jgi:hypothetical protein